MLASIHPLGERGRGTNWTLTVCAYLLASAFGGALLGGLAGAVGAVLGRVLPSSWTARAIAVVVLVGAAAAFDAFARERRVPGPRRQVDEDWLSRYRGVVYGAGFGFQLGLGVTTIVTTALVWVVPAAAVAIGSLTVGLALGATFGLVRALPVLAARQVDSPVALVALDTTLRRLERRVRIVTPIVAATVAAAALVLVV
ncbi:MAG TPA: hypothetical protein VIB48_11255 [Acidimicrobiia bacterium]|jgi:hypothetical protein